MSLLLITVILDTPTPQTYCYSRHSNFLKPATPKPDNRRHWATSLFSGWAADDKGELGWHRFRRIWVGVSKNRGP